MVKYIMWSSMPLFTIIYPYLAILATSVTIFVIIYPYFAKYTLIWPYLPLFGNICLCLPYRVIYTAVDYIYPYCGYMYVLTLCVLILKPLPNCRTTGQLLLELLHF